MADLTKLTPISQEILAKFGATSGATDSEQVWQQRVYIPSKLSRSALNDSQRLDLLLNYLHQNVLLPDFDAMPPPSFSSLFIDLAGLVRACGNRLDVSFSDRVCKVLMDCLHEEEPVRRSIVMQIWIEYFVAQYSFPKASTPAKLSLFKLLESVSVSDEMPVNRKMAIVLLCDLVSSAASASSPQLSASLAGLLLNLTIRLLRETEHEAGGACVALLTAIFRTRLDDSIVMQHIALVAAWIHHVCAEQKSTLLELQSFYSLIQIIADEWLPLQYLLRDVLANLSQNSSGNIKTIIEKLLRRWGPEPDISVETGLLLFNYRREGLKQLSAILQLPESNDTFEQTMSERIQASWEKQQHRARRIALCLRSPNSHARLFPVTEHNCYFCCDSALPFSLDIALRLPQSARAVGLSLLPPALPGVPQGATTIPLVWTSTSSASLLKTDAGTAQPPEQLSEVLFHRREELKRERERVALNGKPFSKAIDISYPSVPHSFATSSQSYINEHWQNVALEQLGVPAGFLLPCLNVVGPVSGVKPALIETDPVELKSGTALDVPAGFFTDSPFPFPLPAAEHVSSRQAALPVLNCEDNGHVTTLQLSVPCKYTIQSASASQSLDFFDFFLGAKFQLELHWHQPQLSQQFSPSDALKFKLFETSSTFELEIVDVRSSHLSGDLFPPNVQSKTSSEHRIEVGTIVTLQAACRTAPLARYDIYAKVIRQVFATDSVADEAPALIQRSQVAGRTLSKTPYFTPPVNVPPFPCAARDGILIFPAPKRPTEIPTEISWVAEESDGMLVPRASWNDSVNIPPKSMLAGYTLNGLPFFVDLATRLPNPNGFTADGVPYYFASSMLTFIDLCDSKFAGNPESVLPRSSVNISHLYQLFLTHEPPRSQSAETRLYNLRTCGLDTVLLTSSVLPTPHSTICFSTNTSTSALTLASLTEAVQSTSTTGVSLAAKRRGSTMLGVTSMELTVAKPVESFDKSLSLTSGPRLSSESLTFLSSPGGITLTVPMRFQIPTLVDPYISGEFDVSIEQSKAAAFSVRPSKLDMRVAASHDLQLVFNPASIKVKSSYIRATMQIRSRGHLIKECRLKAFVGPILSVRNKSPLLVCEHGQRLIADLEVTNLSDDPLVVECALLPPVSRAFSLVESQTRIPGNKSGIVQVAFIPVTDGGDECNVAFLTPFACSDPLIFRVRAHGGTPIEVGLLDSMLERSLDVKDKSSALAADAQPTRDFSLGLNPLRAKDQGNSVFGFSSGGPDVYIDDTLQHTIDFGIVPSSHTSTRTLQLSNRLTESVAVSLRSTHPYLLVHPAHAEIAGHSELEIIISIETRSIDFSVFHAEIELVNSIQSQVRRFNVQAFVGQPVVLNSPPRSYFPPIRCGETSVPMTFDLYNASQYAMTVDLITAFEHATMTKAWTALSESFIVSHVTACTVGAHVASAQSSQLAAVIANANMNRSTTTAPKLASALIRPSQVLAAMNSRLPSRASSPEHTEDLMANSNLLPLDLSERQQDQLDSSLGHNLLMSPFSHRTVTLLFRPRVLGPALAPLRLRLSRFCSSKSSVEYPASPRHESFLYGLSLHMNLITEARNLTDMHSWLASKWTESSSLLTLMRADEEDVAAAIEAFAVADANNQTSAVEMIPNHVELIDDWHPRPLVYSDADLDDDELEEEYFNYETQLQSEKQSIDISVPADRLQILSSPGLVVRKARTGLDVTHIWANGRDHCPHHEFVLAVSPRDAAACVLPVKAQRIGGLIVQPSNCLMFGRAPIGLRRRQYLMVQNTSNVSCRIRLSCSQYPHATEMQRQNDSMLARRGGAQRSWVSYFHIKEPVRKLEPKSFCVFEVDFLPNVDGEFFDYLQVWANPFIESSTSSRATSTFSTTSDFVMFELGLMGTASMSQITGLPSLIEFGRTSENHSAVSEITLTSVGSVREPVYVLISPPFAINESAFVLQPAPAAAQSLCIAFAAPMPSSSELDVYDSLARVIVGDRIHSVRLCGSAGTLDVGFTADLQYSNQLELGAQRLTKSQTAFVWIRNNGSLPARLALPNIGKQDSLTTRLRVLDSVVVDDDVVDRDAIQRSLSSTSETASIHWNWLKLHRQWIKILLDSSALHCSTESHAQFVPRCSVRDVNRAHENELFQHSTTINNVLQPRQSMCLLVSISAPRQGSTSHFFKIGFTEEKEESVASTSVFSIAENDTTTAVVSYLAPSEFDPSWLQIGGMGPTDVAREHNRMYDVQIAELRDKARTRDDVSLDDTALTFNQIEPTRQKERSCLESMWARLSRQCLGRTLELPIVASFFGSVFIYPSFIDFGTVPAARYGSQKAGVETAVQQVLSTMSSKDVEAGTKTATSTQCLTQTSNSHVRCILLENRSIIPQTITIEAASPATSFSVRLAHSSSSSSQLTLRPGQRFRLPVTFTPSPSGLSVLGSVRLSHQFGEYTTQLQGIGASARVEVVNPIPFFISSAQMMMRNTSRLLLRNDGQLDASFVMSCYTLGFGLLAPPPDGQTKFSSDADERNELSGVIPAGQFASVYVAYTPTRDEDFQTEVLLRWRRTPASPFEERRLPLHVTIAHPRLALSVERCHFGSVFLNRTGMQQVELINEGDGPCTWMCSDLPAALSIEPKSGLLEPGDKVTILLYFRPVDVLPLSCNLVFSGKNCNQVSLACVGMVSVAQISFPDSIDVDFGISRIGQSNIGRFELFNPGAIAVEFVAQFVSNDISLQDLSQEVVPTGTDLVALGAQSNFKSGVFRVVKPRGLIPPKTRFAVEFAFEPSEYMAASSVRFHIRVGLQDLNHQSRMIEFVSIESRLGTLRGVGGAPIPRLVVRDLVRPDLVDETGKPVSSSVKWPAPIQEGADALMIGFMLAEDLFEDTVSVELFNDGNMDLSFFIRAADLIRLPPMHSTRTEEIKKGVASGEVLMTPMKGTIVPSSSVVFSISAIYYHSGLFQQLFDIMLDQGRCPQRGFLVLSEAGAPSLIIDPRSITFGICQRDTRTSHTLTLRNGGSFPLQFLCSIRLPATADQAEQDAKNALIKVFPARGEIGINQNLHVEVQFLPTHEIPVNYDLVFGWVGPSVRVPITAQGGSPKFRLEFPRVNNDGTESFVDHLDNTCLDLDVCIVGVPKRSRIRLVNDGNLGAHFQLVSNALWLALDGDMASGQAQHLAAFSSVDIPVIITPLKSGPLQTSLDIKSPARDLRAPVRLLAGLFSLQVGSELDFRDVNIMTWHKRALTITNSGEIACTVRVEVESMSNNLSAAAGQGFIVDPDSVNANGCVELQPTTAQVVHIRFRSDHEGTCSGIVRITPLLTGAPVSRVRVKAEAALLRVICIEPDLSIDMGKIRMGEKRSVQRTLLNPTRFTLRFRLSLPTDREDDIRVWSFEPAGELVLEPNARLPITIAYTSLDSRENHWHEVPLSVRNAITDEVDMEFFLRGTVSIPRLSTTHQPSLGRTSHATFDVDSSKPGHLNFGRILINHVVQIPLELCNFGTGMLELQARLVAPGKPVTELRSSSPPSSADPPVIVGSESVRASSPTSPDRSSASSPNNAGSPTSLIRAATTRKSVAEARAANTTPIRADSRRTPINSTAFDAVLGPFRILIDCESARDPKTTTLVANSIRNSPNLLSASTMEPFTSARLDETQRVLVIVQYAPTEGDCEDNAEGSSAASLVIDTVGAGQHVISISGAASTYLFKQVPKKILEFPDLFVGGVSDAEFSFWNRCTVRNPISCATESDTVDKNWRALLIEAALDSQQIESSDSNEITPAQLERQQQRTIDENRTGVQIFPPDFFLDGTSTSSFKPQLTVDGDLDYDETSAPVAENIDPHICRVRLRIPFQVTEAGVIDTDSIRAGVKALLPDLTSFDVPQTRSLWMCSRSRGIEQLTLRYKVRAHEVSFSAPFLDFGENLCNQPTSLQVNLYSLSPDPMPFEIECTHPDMFTTFPSSGILEPRGRPGATVALTIRFVAPGHFATEEEAVKPCLIAKLLDGIVPNRSLALIGSSSDFVFNTKYLGGLDFGPSLLTQNNTVRRQLTLHNTGRAPVTYSMRIIPYPSLWRQDVPDASKETKVSFLRESSDQQPLVFEIFDNWRGTVSGGEFVFVTFLFKPTVEREFSGEIEISAPQGLYCLPISGVGISPSISVNTNHVDFGMVGFDFSLKRIVQVTNTCTLPIKLRMNGAHALFECTIAKAYLHPGTTTQVSITYAPKAPDPKSAAARLAAAAKVTKAAAALAGTTSVLPENAITVPDRCKLDLYHADWSPILQHVDCVGAAGPLSLKFSTREMNLGVVPSGASTTRSLTISNDGLVPVTLIASSIETQDEADATPIKLAGGDILVVAPSVFTIHPGQSIALNLQFSIASSGRLRFLLRLNLGFSLKRRCWAVVFNVVGDRIYLSNEMIKALRAERSVLTAPVDGVPPNEHLMRVLQLPNEVAPVSIHHELSIPPPQCTAPSVASMIALPAPLAPAVLETFRRHWFAQRGSLPFSATDGSDKWREFEQMLELQAANDQIETGERAVLAHRSLIPGKGL